MQTIHLTEESYQAYIKDSQNSIVKKKKKPKNPIRKGRKGMNRHFTEEDTQMANKQKTRFSASLTLREIQIQTTMRTTQIKD